MIHLPSHSRATRTLPEPGQVPSRSRPWEASDGMSPSIASAPNTSSHPFFLFCLHFRCPLPTQLYIAASTSFSLYHFLSPSLCCRTA